jgi:hypothetical protein
LRFTRVLLLALILISIGRSAHAQEPPMRSTGFHGFLFGDVVYVTRERASNDGFLVGQLVGHGNVRMSERVSAFGEVSATAQPGGYSLEVERVILRYDFADQFKLSAGRYHTPSSYWNTAFHHGLWLQTSVARPEIIRIGGRFIPVHFVGAMAEGTLNAGNASLSYEAGVGNGRGAIVSRGGDAGDINRARASLFAARVRPFDNGLAFGASVYFDRATVDSASYNERITSAHVVWDRGAPELIAEYARVNHDPRQLGDESVSDGWYAHAGWRLGGPLYRFKPYVRVEHVDVSMTDPVFAQTLTDYRAGIAGLRYDFDALATLKGEYRRERFGANAPYVNGFYVQVAFAIAGAGVM